MKIEIVEQLKTHLHLYSNAISYFFHTVDTTTHRKMVSGKILIIEYLVALYHKF